jgi:D-3-phosphoglycerate dehydrogenase
MYKIKTYNKISPAGLRHFPKGEFSVSADHKEPDAIIVRSASLHDTEFPSSLKAIARAGAGVNNIPLDRCSEAGIVVFNTPGANANAVKELAIGSIINAARNIVGAVNWTETLKGKGDEVPKLVEKGKGKFVGPEIAGKKLGVIGLGSIGVLVANAASNLDMDVYGYDPYLSVSAAWGVSRATHRASSLREIYEKCDFITLHVPLTPETKGLINAQTISLMKRGVHIINLARGDLAVNKDIIEGLGSGQIGSYTLDFPCDELLGVPGVTSIPHLGASTPESEDNCASTAAEELISFLRTGEIRNSVNFPDLQLPVWEGRRITAVHRNVPNVISQISSLFGEVGVNIENMLDKSKKNYAYTVLDINGGNIDAVIEKLKALDSVIRVRVIK